MRVETLFEEFRYHGELPNEFRKDILYHGFTKPSLRKWQKVGSISNEYNFNKPTAGLFLTNDINIAFLHGNYIFSLQLTYLDHIKMIEVCNANKRGLIVDDYEYFDELDEDIPECFYDGYIDYPNIISMYVFNAGKWYDNVMKLDTTSTFR